MARLATGKRPEKDTHIRVFRPWGWYETLALGERFQVKRIMVNPGASLSLQLHHHRAEHWVVVKGMARSPLEKPRLCCVKINPHISLLAPSIVLSIRAVRRWKSLRCRAERTWERMILCALKTITGDPEEYGTRLRQGAPEFSRAAATGKQL